MSKPARAARQDFMGEDERSPVPLDKDAQIYERMRTRLVRLFGPRPWIEDIVNDAFETFLRRRESFRGEGSLQGWADRIALNAARDQMRRQKRRALLDDLFLAQPRWPALSPTPEATAVDRDRIRRLDSVMERIPPDQRMAYLLYHVENRTVGEIADLVGASEHAVRKRISRARDAIHRRARRDPVLAEWLAGRQGTT